MVAWYTAGDPARLLAAWDSAPVENEELCGMLLGVARTQVLAYAPEQAPAVYQADAPEVPENLVYAQLQQAKNLHSAGTVSRGGEFGEGEFSYQPRPLDKTIRGIIRPVQGALHVL